MPTAYVYSRFSSAKQERGHSLKRQRDLAQKWLETTGADLGVIEDTSLTLTDSGLSGYKGTHRKKGALGVLERMVEDGLIEEGSYLLVENLDRLSRQEPIEAMTLLLSLVGAGMNVVTLADNKIYSREVINADKGMSLIQSVLTAGRAYEESVIKGQRVAAAWMNKFKRVTEGVQLTKKVPFWIEKSDKNQLIPERVTVVQRIFQMAAEGVGDGTIARTLNAESVPTPTGKGSGWGNSSIMKVRKSRNALGELQTGDGVLHKEYYPTVVSEELWLLANSKNDVAIQPKTRDVNNTHPLTGLCVCAQCGQSAHRSIKTGRVRKDGTRNRWYSLECSGAKKGTSNCMSRRISYKKILDPVLNAIWRHEYIEDVGSSLIGLSEVKGLLHERLQIVKELMGSRPHDQILQAEYSEILKELGDLGNEEAEFLKINSTAARRSASSLKSQLFDERRITSAAVMGLVKKVSIDFAKEELYITMRDGVVIPEMINYDDLEAL